MHGNVCHASISGYYPSPRLDSHTTLINKAALTKTLLQVIACLPLRLNHCLGAAIGWAIGRLSARNQKTVHRNLQLCFPDLSQQQHNKLAKQNFLETGKNLTELAAFWFWPKERVARLIKEEVGRDHLDHARSLGKGVIFASPHFGAWELSGLMLSTQAPLHIMYRPNRNKDLDVLTIESRQRFGGQCCPTTNRGLSQLVRGLKKNESIGVLPDQEPPEDHGVFAPFFGVPAYTMTFMNNLARKTGAPVIFAVTERMPRGQGYRMHYINPEDDLYHEDSVRAATALNKCVEQCVEIAPAQYMWNYKRLRKSPVGAPERYSQGRLHTF